MPDYPKVLRIGWRGIRDEAESLAAIRRLHAGAERPGPRGRHLRRGRARRSSERYATRRPGWRSRETEPARRAELVEIARICRKVPWAPAGTFPEALQALWTTHMLLMAAESYPGPGVSPGRVDQYLYPVLRGRPEPLAASRREQAKEWLECWWIKHNYVYDYPGLGGHQPGDQLLLRAAHHPGRDEGATGSDASNDLTYLMLDVIEEINLLEPKPNVRIHATDARPAARARSSRCWPNARGRRS